MPTSAILEKTNDDYEFVRLFTHPRTSVRRIAQLYFSKFPNDTDKALYVAARRKCADGEIKVVGDLLEMDKPEQTCADCTKRI